MRVYLFDGSNYGDKNMQLLTQGEYEAHFSHVNKEGLVIFTIHGYRFPITQFVPMNNKLMRILYGL